MRHPAKYSDALLPIFASLLPDEGIVLDPFAGTGRIHELMRPRLLTVGVELEPEWAELHPQTMVGDALHLPPEWTGKFDAVCTSPTYGNRMADHHEAKDPCKACEGTGWKKWNATGTYPGPRCPKCDGTGLSRRNTYKHALGREPSDGSSTVMQWGVEYRTFHQRAWYEVWRVLKPGGRFLLNIKDHYRTVKKGEPAEHQRVSSWHDGAIRNFGFERRRAIKVPLSGNGFGQNGKVRVPHEWVLAYDKPSWVSPQELA